MARRMLAVLVAVALLWQAAGVINALEVDPTAHCCCGDHDGGTPCGCPDCPGHGGLRWARPHAPGPPRRGPSLAGCQGRATAAALVALPAMALAATPALTAPRLAATVAAIGDAAPAGRVVHPSRPPS